MWCYFFDSTRQTFISPWVFRVCDSSPLLYKVIGTRTLDDETLSTFTCEVEAMMNSRPLTHVSSDPTDDEPLTPNHLLLGRPTNNLPPGLFLPRHTTDKKTWKQAQALSEQFRYRYLKDYLPTLTTRTKWTKQVENLQQGDLDGYWKT